MESSYSEQDLALVFFCPSHGNVEPFHIDATVQATASGQWQLDVTLSDGFLDRRKIEQDRYRLNALLQAGLALYELCFPCSLKMYWDEIYLGWQVYGFVAGENIATNRTIGTQNLVITTPMESESVYREPAYLHR